MQFALGVLQLKPWEFYGYSNAEYHAAIQGYQLKNEIYLDSVRWLATVQAKLAGAKKIKKPQDLMKLPLIDGRDQKEQFNKMVEFLKARKAGG